MFDTATRTQPILYSIPKSITSSYSASIGGYCIPKIYYFNGYKILLYYNVTLSLWCIRKYKIETNINDLDPVSSSNYIEYSIPNSSYCATTIFNMVSYDPFLSYENGVYFLKLYDYSSGTSNIVYFLKYSYDLQTWYDYSENGSSCGSTSSSFINKQLPQYCNGYYYYVILSGTNLIIYYKTSLTAAYTTATLNVPANGIIMSPIYYVNNKYYMLVGYGVNEVPACNVYLYESSVIYSGYTTNYNVSLVNDWGSGTRNTYFGIYKRSILVNNTWIINFNIEYSNSGSTTSFHIFIYNFNLSTRINSYIGEYINYNTSRLCQVTDKFVIYNTRYSGGSSTYPLGCIIVKLEDFTIKTYNIMIESENIDLDIIIPNNAYILTVRMRSDANIYLSSYSLEFPKFTNITDNFYIKGN